MSRNIPRVKRWFVRYYDANNKLIYIGVVSAPTKFLARLNVREAMFGNTKWFNAWRTAERVTYTVITKGEIA